MNAVLLTSKARKKVYDDAIKTMMDFKIISFMPVIKSVSVTQIESINPHCVIIDASVKFKDIDLEGFICLLRLKTPDIRVIYNFGTIDDVKDEQFNKTLKFMIQQKVNDIIINDADIKEIIENPLKFGDINEKIDEIIKENEKQRAVYKQDTGIDDVKEKETKGKPVELNFFVLSGNRNFDIENITEIIDDSQTNKKSCIVIAIMQIQHHLGCTRTSFDIAKLLYSQMKNPCIVMEDDETYKNMLKFYRYKTSAASEGFSLNNIHILPKSELEEAKKTYTHVILDIGYFRPEHELEYKKSDIKIMMCSSAEWDLIHMDRWFNYPKYDYTVDINYLFISSKQRYIQLNKLLLKGDYISNRIDFSDEGYNKKVYGLILKRYELSNSNKQKKRKLMKLK